MKHNKLILTLGILALPATGCELIEIAGATVVVSGIVVATPEVKLAGQFDLERHVIATAWVGEREGPTSSREPDPISGAAVSVRFGDRTVRLDEHKDEKGLYIRTSTQSADLVYQAGDDYTFDAALVDVHGGEAKAPELLTVGAMNLSPTPDRHPLVPDILVHPKSTALQINWDESFGSFSYVSVVRADPMNPEKPEIVFDTRPESAVEVIRLLASDPIPSVDIPADTFAEDGVYGIILITADRGHARSNTFIASPFMVGSGAAVIVAVGSVSL